jgi:hypothetical protein
MNYDYDTLNERKWEYPGDYGGFSPVDDVVIAGQSRDSDCLERSNYETIFDHLKTTEETLSFQFPDEFEKAYALNDGDLFIYDYRAGHWAVGWVETMLMSQHAPDCLQMEVVSVLNALADYPVFDDSHFSELEWTESNDYWADLSVGDRVEIIQEHGGNIFSARYDHLTENADPNGMVLDYLRTP